MGPSLFLLDKINRHLVGYVRGFRCGGSESKPINEVFAVGLDDALLFHQCH